MKNFIALIIVSFLLGFTPYKEIITKSSTPSLETPIHAEFKRIISDGYYDWCEYNIQSLSTAWLALVPEDGICQPNWYFRDSRSVRKLWAYSGKIN